ncbi:MAG: GAF domain-containing sensor histidine kinase [Verrucomicrobiales bacterium]|nr:GAF domain-containing sensor histidine kinase [Verrucomicrobiales bacterium]
MRYFSSLQAGNEFTVEYGILALWVWTILAILLCGVWIGRYFQQKKLAALQKEDLETQVRIRTSQYRKANAELTQLHKISGVLSEVSTKFINLPITHINEEIPVALSRIASAVGGQRASISLFEKNRKFVRLRHEWSPPGIIEIEEQYFRFDLSEFPWIYQRIINGIMVVISNPEIDFPPDAEKERQAFLKTQWESMAIIPLSVGGAAIGYLEISTTNQPHEWPDNIVDALAVSGQVFANALDRSQRMTAMISLRQEAINAEDRERTRISRELHDQLGGSLTGLRIHSRALEKRLENNPELAGNAQRITQIIDDTMPDVRRICSELRAPILDDIDIQEAVEELAVDFTKNTGIPCRYDLQFSGSLAPDRVRDETIHRITSELLTNIIRHSEASKASISLGRNTDLNTVILTVKDNGCGVDFEELKRKRKHLGLRGITERAQLINGNVSISNLNPGFAVKVTVPEIRHE